MRDGASPFPIACLCSPLSGASSRRTPANGADTWNAICRWTRSKRFCVRGYLRSVPVTANPRWHGDGRSFLTCGSAWATADSAFPRRSPGGLACDRPAPDRQRHRNATLQCLRSVHQCPNSRSAPFLSQQRGRSVEICRFIMCLRPKPIGVLDWFRLPASGFKSFSTWLGIPIANAPRKSLPDCRDSRIAGN